MPSKDERNAAAIMLDLDGVVFNMVEATFELLNHFHPARLNTLPIMSWRDYWRKKQRGVYEIDVVYTAYRQFHQHDVVVTAQGMWSLINERGHAFWADMRPYDHARTLIETAWARVGVDNVYFVTSPSRSHYSASGKVEALARLMREYVGLHSGIKRADRQYVLTPHKHLLARPTAMLVDDNEQQCREFREADGCAVTFPQPWNWSGMSFADVVTFMTSYEFPTKSTTTRR